MAAGQKKVVLRTKSGRVAWGYLRQSGFVECGKVSLMDPDGKLSSFDLKEIRTIAYVRDFNLDDSVDPEKIGRRTFSGRPRGDGLWVRVTFPEGEVLEGLASVQGGFVDSLIEDRGVTLTPPDTRGNTQRVFVPREAVSLVEVVGFVTAPSKRTNAAKKRDGQASLFEG